MNTVYVISHSHFDAEVFKTREDYLPWGYANLIDALSQLEHNAQYKYVLDQVCLIEPFLENYPEMKEPMLRFIKEGRLEIANGMYAMADVNLVHGESIVRQLKHAQEYFRGELGVTATTGWYLDTFGLSKQLPQLLSKACVNSVVHQRGNPGDTSEYHWVSPDGSGVIGHWCSQTYGSMGEFPSDLPGFSRHVERIVARLSRFAKTGVYLLFEGHDLSSPRADLTALIDMYNHNPDRKFNLVMAMAKDYINHLQSLPDLPAVDYDMNPIFQGIYSARIKVKQLNRTAENLLLTTEALNAIDALSGQPSLQCAIDRAWRPILFSQFHDVIAGCHIDDVYRNVIRRFHQSSFIAEEIRDASYKRLLSRIDTRDCNQPIVVYNPLAWEREDIVEADISFARDTVFSISIADSNGNEAPCQLDEVRHHANGAIRQAKLSMIATVPSLGYKTYTLRENAPSGVISHMNSSQEESVTSEFVGMIENEFYRIECDRWNGEILSLFCKETGDELVDRAKGCFGAVIKQGDEGDFWQIDSPLHINISPTPRIHPLPDHARAKYSTDHNGYGNARHAAVKAEWTYTGKANGMFFDTRLTIYAGLRRIDFETHIFNQDERVRYRAAFPVTIRNGTITREIPFGMTAQPEGEMPSLNWTDYSDGTRGLAVLNCWLPGNAVIDDVMLLSLMRCVSYVQYSGGGYDPNTPAAEGHEVGKKHHFSYSLLPHAGDWRNAGLARAGQERNNPLVALKTVPHDGALPSSHSFLEIDAENIVMTSFCARKNGAALRFYESQGEYAHARIGLPWSVKAAYRTNLLEDDDTCELLFIDDGKIMLDVRPFEVVTVVIEV